MKTSWGEQGKQLLSKIDCASETDLETMADATINLICEREPTREARTNALKSISREILKRYPRRTDEADGYWFDEAGKKDQPHWRHNIFKYLTFGRTVPAATTVPTTTTTSPTPATVPTTTTTPSTPTTSRTTASRNTKPQHPLKNMTPEQLNLDADTQATLESALAHSGMALEDFIKQAIKVYANTIAGKAKQRFQDLSAVSTEALLSDPKYGTHPARAVELTLRAISAIKAFNSNTPDPADRWCITQSAIASLTGSRQSSIGKVLEQFQDDIASHNQKYQLNAYSNRKPDKRDIRDVINLAQLIPDGIDGDSEALLPADRTTGIDGDRTFNKKLIGEKPIIKDLNHQTTLIDIFDYLGKTPGVMVRLKEGNSQTLTYERIDDERGFLKGVRILETGEEILENR